MQREIILIGVTSSKMLFFGAFLLIFRMNCLIQRRGLGERAKAFLGFI